MRWIKMRVELHDDPAVIAISEATGLDEFGVVGRLHRLWSWADVHTTNGNASSVTRTFIDRYLKCDGFAEAMVKAGWLSFEHDGLQIPKFGDHNGETGKQKAVTAKRVAKHKAKGNAKVTPSPLLERYPPEEEPEEEQIPASGAFAELSNEDLEDPSKVDAWFERQKSKSKPVVGSSSDARLMVHGAAAKAVSKEAKPKNPVALFGWIVADPERWKRIPARDLEEARKRINALDAKSRAPPNGRAADVPLPTITNSDYRRPE